MAQAVQMAQYYKMVVSNKTGQGLKILDHLQKSKVDLLSLLAFPKKGKAQVDFVPVDATKFTAAMKQAKWKIKGPKTCFIIESKDQIGALVPYATKLTASPSIWETTEGEAVILELIGLDSGAGYLQMTHQGPNLDKILQHGHWKSIEPKNEI